jgi:hypothetical protein
MENVWMPSWLSSASSNSLLSLQGVQQPCEDPSVDYSFNYRTQRVLFSSLCLPACCLNALLAEYLLAELPAVLSPSAHPLHMLNAHLAELSESSVILFLLELTVEFLSMHLCAYAQCPLGRALQNSQQSFCLQLCLSYTTLPPRYSVTLRSSPSC